jgi:hypothetical protein
MVFGIGVWLSQAYSVASSNPAKGMSIALAHVAASHTVQR